MTGLTTARTSRQTAGHVMCLSQHSLKGFVLLSFPLYDIHTGSILPLTFETKYS